MARPVTGLDIYGAKKNTENIMAIFKKTGARAGAAKCPITFKIPIKRAVIPIKKIYGNMILVNITVNASFSGESEKPGAIKRIISGASSIPIIDKTARIIERSQVAAFASLNAAAFPSFL